MYLVCQLIRPFSAHPDFRHVQDLALQAADATEIAEHEARQKARDAVLAAAETAAAKANLRREQRAKKVAAAASKAAAASEATQLQEEKEAAAARAAAEKADQETQKKGSAPSGTLEGGDVIGAEGAGGAGGILVSAGTCGKSGPSGVPLVAIQPRPSEGTAGDSVQGAAGSRNSAAGGIVPAPDAPQPSGGDSSSGGAPSSRPKRHKGEGYNRYNSLCSKCNTPEQRYRKRARLCDDSACGRWVHTGEIQAFAQKFEEYKMFSMSRKTTASKCCVHNKPFQTHCPCRR